MNLGLRGQERLRLSIIYALCAIVLIWALAPIYWVAVSSISDASRVVTRALTKSGSPANRPWNLIARSSTKAQSFAMADSRRLPI